jgi:hypothetical protein
MSKHQTIDYNSENRYLDLFSHPITLQLFMFGLHERQEISLRDAQRKLGIKNPSSVHWHINKLVDAGVMKQHPNNRYSVTEIGLQLKSINIPIPSNYLIFNGTLYNSIIFNLAFIISALLINVILLFIDTRLATIFLTFVLLAQTMILYREFRRLQSLKGITN